MTVLPFDEPLGLPDPLSRRNARNTSALLIEESHVAKVTDPAGGSFAVEQLTHDLAAAGWAEFTRIESEGDIPEDDAHKLTEHIQKITDEYIEKVEETLKTKEAEIMEV